MTGKDRARLQGTVAGWGEEGGSAVLDDGRRLDLPRELLESSVFRFVRPGQRVELLVVDAAVTWMGLPGTTPP